MDMTPYLQLMSKKVASDLFFSVGAPVNMKVEGIIQPLGGDRLSAREVKELAYSIMSNKQQIEFEETMELNMAISMSACGRYRVNVFRQRGKVSMVVRYIKGDIPSLEELHLPLVFKDVVMEMRGLVLVVGATSSGKSTALASMIDYRNQHHRGHILTIEDPIEYLYVHKESIVNQREVGIDTRSYADALKNAMREAPDVILIGEIRDMSTMKHAISYAETGHLCLSTLHSNSTNQAMDRVLNFFEDTSRKQLLLDLSLNIRAIIGLRLIPGLKKRRIPAVEVMLNTPYIASLIEKGKIEEIKEVIAKGRGQGMQTFDQSLFELYKEGEISLDNAIRYADSRNNLGLQIGLSEEKDFDSGDLSIDKDDESGGISNF